MVIGRILVRLVAFFMALIVLGFFHNAAQAQSSGIVQVVSGIGFSCALTNTGGVECWGSNLHGQLGNSTNFSTTNPNPSPLQVTGLASGVKAISAGRDFACALTNAGGVLCWGSNGTMSIGPSTVGIGQLGNGSLSAAPSATPVQVSGLTSGVVAITTGGDHSCALTNTGSVLCWGYNLYFELGNSTTNNANSATPVQVLGLTSGVTAISAGNDHTCALFNGTVQCWGNNNNGELGNASAAAAQATPIQVTGLSGVKAISAGGLHTCALTSSGGVECWGANLNGQLGNNQTASLAQNTPVQVTGLTSGVTAIAAGSAHTCALNSIDSMQCWGDNSFGQLGNSTNFSTPTPNSSPVAVTGLSSVVSAISTGGNNSCALTSSGSVFCWGDNSFGQLGNSASSNTSSVPFEIRGFTNVFTMIAAGTDHACGLTHAGGVICWGDNNNGELGNASAISNGTPVQVNGLASGVTAIAAGYNHTCALTNSGGVLCWGGNHFGQLGNSTGMDPYPGVPFVPFVGDIYPTPQAVPGLSGVTAIAAGFNFTCAVTAGGAVQCWGDNRLGQLGNNSTAVSVATPVVQVSSLTGVKAISVGENHACALTTTGGVLCWGENNYGQLGNNSTANALTPVQANLTGGVTAIAAGYYHTCAINSSGGVQCWGNNGSGQLGNNSTSNSPIPVQVAGLTSGIVGIAAGGVESCALNSAGGVQCWGGGGNGQLGNGNINNSQIPVQVANLTTGVTSIAVGGDSFGSGYVCAQSNPSVLCWGGLAGMWTMSSYLTPVLGQFNFPQTIAFFGQQPNVIVGNLGAGTVNVTVSSGLPVALTSATPTTCSVSGQIVTGLAPGTCTINANQPGDGATFTAAPQVSLNLAIQAAPTYSLSGTVLGAGGIAMPNVTVTLEDVNSNFVAKTTTLADGSYSFSSLPWQSYYFDFSYAYSPTNAGAPGSPYIFTIHHLDLGGGNLLLPLVSNTSNYALQLPFVAVSGHTLDINHVSIPNVPLTLDYYSNYQTTPLNLNAAGTSTGTLYDYLSSNTSAMGNAGSYTLWIFSTISGVSSWNLGWAAPANSNFTASGTQLVPAGTTSQDLILPYASAVIPPPLFLAGPSVPYLSNTSAVIEWETDEPSDTEVFYKANPTNAACPTSAAANTTSGGPDATPNAANMATHHTYYISPLTSGTPYCYYAKSMVSLTKGNSTFNTYPLTTLTTPSSTDSLAPVFTSGPMVTTTSSTSATFEWTTNKPAIWTLFYKKSGSILPPTALNAPTGSYALHQTAMLTGLTPATAYTVTVSAIDPLNNTVTSDATNPLTLTTALDTTTPVIVGTPLVTDLTDTQATVTWTTDKPTNSNLSYNDGIHYFVINDGFINPTSTPAIVPEFRTAHSVRLTGLSSGLAYNVTVAPVDASGIATSPTALTPFSTVSASTAPVILNPPDIVQVTNTTAMVHWLTDVPSDSVVTYGTTPGGVLNQTEAHGVLETEHSVLLGGLTPGTAYSFQVQSTSAAPSLTNPGFSSTLVTGTFSTASTMPGTAPVKTICPNDQTSPQVIYVGSDRVTFEWCTDEPTDAYVECAPLATPTALTRVSDPVQRTRHQITVTNLVMSSKPQCHGRSADLQGRAVTW